MTRTINKTWGLALLVVGTLGTAAGIGNIYNQPRNFFNYAGAVGSAFAIKYGLERLNDNSNKPADNIIR
jgi:hypothetical protein